MTKDEYSDLFHRTQANLVAFKPLMECDDAVIKMIEAAVPAKKWKGLSTAETKVLWNLTKKPREYAEMIEAKLKERNT